jgi:hypothetical protein
MINKKLLYGGVLFTSVVCLNAASVIVTNINGDAAYGLFDQSGSRVSGSFSDNIRIGYFESSFNPDTAWSNGDIALLNTNFVQYGDSFGMLDDFDGVINGAPDVESTPFVGNQITLWATDGSSFTSQSGQHLIYTFDSLTFEEEPWIGGQVLLGTDSGSFLNESGFASGEFGNFSYDYELGGGALPGFNTVSPVPEPSTYALFAGVFALGYIMIRRSRSKA